MRVLRWRLFPKYAAMIIALVAALLVSSGAVGLYFSWRELQDHVVSLQFEKAEAAATRIEQYVLDIEQQVSWTALPGTDASSDLAEQRRFDYLKLLRQAQAITEVTWIDAEGREQLRVSRLAMDAVGRGTDHSGSPMFVQASTGKVWRSGVSFRKETEPYMTIARRAGSGGGVTAVDVNLKFVWDVVSRIQIGKSGLAYVVDGRGTLIAHPDISLVLKKTDLSQLPQVAANLAGRPSAADERALDTARDIHGERVLAAHAQIPLLGWTVYVESPRAEAFQPLYQTMLRMTLVLAAGLALAMLASFFLARALVRPIRALQEGTARVAAGELTHRIEVHSGDELEVLAGQFNRMSGELAASYAGLERKVDERTAELSMSLERQTATAEILQVISRSVSDAQPVFDAIVGACQRLFGGLAVNLLLPRGDVLVRVANAGSADFGSGAAVGGARGPMSWPLDDRSVSGACVLESRVVAVDDADAIEARHSRSAELSRQIGWRSALFVPLLRDGRGTGCIGILRASKGGFSDKEVALAQTFADQAVIAIQNAQLFNETREALERQTATAEILQVISRSVSDAQPVFERILQSCRRLFDSNEQGILLLGEDGRVHVACHDGKASAALRLIFEGEHSPVPGAQLVDQIRQRVLLNVSDVLSGDEVPAAMREVARRLDIGHYSQVVAPMAWEDRAVGLLYAIRQPAKGFSEREAGLLQTFADQAVIAIQNARLFREIEDKTRQLEDANRHKSEFLANMSHELRTPLNAIIGFSEALTEQMFGEVNDKQMEYLQDIHSSGQHLLSLINDVLDLSKIEAGKMELELSAFDLGLLLEHSTTLVRERAQRHGLTLKLDIGEGLDDWVADARKVKQTVVNLLSNAVKFTPNGGTVTVRARRLDHADGHAGSCAEVQVIDTGIGIKPEDQALVFEEFRQASGDVLRKSEGTGLGLALVKRFVELHGGRVSLQSTPGQGSTFTITLPQRELEAIQ